LAAAISSRSSGPCIAVSPALAYRKKNGHSGRTNASVSFGPRHIDLPVAKGIVSRFDLAAIEP
jgi:hypothetical protein